MDTLVSDCLLKLEFGEIQRFKNIGIIPLFTLPNHGPEYLMLKDALDKKPLMGR